MSLEYNNTADLDLMQKSVKSPTALIKKVYAYNVFIVVMII